MTNVYVNRTRWDGDGVSWLCGMYVDDCILGDVCHRMNRVRRVQVVSCVRRDVVLVVICSDGDMCWMSCIDICEAHVAFNVIYIYRLYWLCWYTHML